MNLPANTSPSEPVTQINPVSSRAKRHFPLSFSPSMECMLKGCIHAGRANRDNTKGTKISCFIFTTLLPGTVNTAFFRFDTTHRPYVSILPTSPNLFQPVRPVNQATPIVQFIALATSTLIGFHTLPTEVGSDLADLFEGSFEVIDDFLSEYI